MKKKEQERLQELQDTLTGASLSFSWWAPYKKLEEGERATAASALHATDETLSAKKRLIDTRSDGAWKNLSALQVKIRGWWDFNSYPYTVKGMRLVLREKKKDLFGQVAEFQGEILEAGKRMDEERGSILAKAEQQLGNMFRADLYPKKGEWHKEFTLEVRERSIEPPSYLQHTNAEEYKQELKKNLQEIQVSMRKFEEGCWKRMGQLSNSLAAGLSPDGKLHASNLAGFQNLFQQVGNLNFEGTAVFKEAMNEARDILDGVSVEELRTLRGLKVDVRQKVEGFLGKFHQLKKTVEEVNE